ncbi:DctP family TRAP transporter solute-binding subunit [Agaribacter marinus]|uniref:DctP family TRAP transporter solute-binding subunit n=1 Tax=Virgibacillus salarius TaxID=447199 RepID=A0A941I9X0_9BACI|nr:DctP family TRAP transporter solute-binding subunit [Virgibacillus salarius]NAZ07466.1 DctP family TRAP transporter solute-binding subunit [Agaribacter marinus]QRZ20095.1 DctP family TRAP transporter solute-binding subunit [Virgibacillus sp. AGTR]
MNDHTLNFLYLVHGGNYLRNFFIILTFIITGLVSAVVIGIDFETIRGTDDYDDEQEGLREQIIIRFSHVVATDTPKGQTARKFAQLVEAKTNGRIKVHIYANGSLYNDTNEWEAIQNGNVEMIAPATAKVSELFPKWGILDLPYAFPTHEAVTEAYEGKIGKTLLANLHNTNVKGLTFWYNGYKQLTNQVHVIKLPDDVNRLHFRIMPSPVIKEQFNQVHASTSSLPFNKTYQNLEVHFIDGQENTISNIYSKKFYEHQPFVTMSNHGYLGYGVFINKPFWESLSEYNQSAIQAALSEATDWGKRHAIEMNDHYTRELRKKDVVTIHFLTTREREQWKNAWKAVYDQMTTIIGNELMDEVHRIQNKYNSRE